MTATIRGADITIELYLTGIAGPAERMQTALPVSWGGGAMGSAYTVGTAFTVAAAGVITHLRYWHTAGCPPGTTHTLSLWTDAGVKVASVADPSASGVSDYRDIALATPYRVTAGTRYRVSVSWNLFAGCETAGAPPSGSPNLTTPAGYLATGTDTFPTIAGNNYHVDVVFRADTEGWQDITCKTTTAEWTWGAPEALGPLTECEGGTFRVSMWDPEREFDPDNPDSPLLGVLKVGLGMRATVDGSPAWTGVLQTWGWDRASRIADLNGLDPIGMLSIRALPERFQMAPVMATSASQAKFVLDFVEWPVGKRFFPDGDSGVDRSNHYVEGSALDALHRIRFAELGRLFPLRDGGIGWHDRNGPATPPPPSAVINCGGVGLTDMWKAMGLGRVRNRVVISGGYGAFGTVRPPDEYRSVTTSAEFLALTAPLTGILQTDLWAETILDALDPPPVLTMLGTILPVDDEVAEVVCAEFGDRWTVASAGDPDKVVQVIGQRVTVAPGTIEVDVVTEDIVVPDPYVHLAVGSGSGAMYSHAATYAAARSGTAVTLFPQSGFSTVYYVGQTFTSGPFYDVWESFLWFDTSAIPVGATILEATFAAMFYPHWVGLTPPPGTWQDFDMELRSYSAGGWRPTLSAADWVPGANLSASYPLRAKANTARALKDSFVTFEDAGTGLAGAVVKGGATQLVLVSSRTTAGTAPTSVTVYEDATLQLPRLRVRYRLP